ncbi:MarR family winged helix-turn-helix transcriptional regulator [Arcanobacterium pinnipediorum]|uniref:MarR family transcriptional regulator n=1 Tax=Arcanobacterium pinnipediorum TaxID=1503041 RepID=A0ABY5AHG8_9ACTO|nr:MarR family transcriptional regulator [Arcanobacterium pinnipediorum]USR79639.1 MarR family transcriptional regulator [Arcanobacterium pinnipediorum]
MTQPRLLDEEEQQAWRNFMRGQATVRDAVNHDDVEDFGLALHEFEVLMRLAEAEEQQARMSVLATDLVHSRSRLTHTVARLEKAGYVERFQCPADRRGIFCRLTDEGQEKIESATEQHTESLRQHFLDKLTREELLTLGEIFAKLIDAEETEKRVCHQ